MTSLKMAVIGDLHNHWDEMDVHHFNDSKYDLLFFTGDLGGGTTGSTLRVARVISKLTRPALVMPGNNDTVDTAEFAAELSHRNGLAALRRLRTNSNSEPDSRAEICGYSKHRFVRGTDLDLTFIAARPHSMGGPNLSFPEFMLNTYGIESLESSEQRLRQLVDEAESDSLIFLAHNGPLGLGGGHEDIWGADFKEEGGDWGDPDLAATLEYARSQGKRVLAVIAGHMHHRTKSGVERAWLREEHGTLFINAAKVPRIYSGGDAMHRHHLSVTITQQQVSVSESFVESDY